MKKSAGGRKSIFSGSNGLSKEYLASSQDNKHNKGITNISNRFMYS